MGADGVNPIHLMILIGDSGGQWLEPHYFDDSIEPLGKVRVIVPASPDHPDALLDACIAFCPGYFEACPSMAGVAAALEGVERLDFQGDPELIPGAWDTLREEARAAFQHIGIWQADLVPLDHR